MTARTADRAREGRPAADPAAGHPVVEAAGGTHETGRRGHLAGAFEWWPGQQSVDKAAAGDKDICILGGPNILQQYLTAGAVDELRLDVAPVLLGRGTRLFNSGSGTPVEFERVRLLESPLATHMIFRVASARGQTVSSI